LKKNWTPTQDAFRRFLGWLDEGVDSDGQRYLEMRRRLVLYFDRKNCLGSDELADEALNRVAQKLDEKGTITGISPAHYCYVAAKFVFLEYLRSADHGHLDMEDILPSRSQSSLAIVKTSDSPEAEERLDCLEQCLSKLPANDRELILEYYQGEQRAKIDRRSQLAVKLGLSMNALSIRACRIRQKLEGCVRKCCMQI
jgi:RNA polymerase sigma factor (sigma-70 family)